MYIFSKGYEGKGIIGLVVYLVGSYNQYVVYPLPYSLVLKWFIYGTIELIAAGVVTALIYKPKEQ